MINNKEYVISIDLGGTNVRVGLISEDCEIIAVNRERTIHDNRHELSNQINRLISYLPYQEYNVKKVGISAAGFIEKGVIKKSINAGLENYDIKHEILKNYPEFKVHVLNDANATALSESRFGATKDVEDSFFLTISTGIGGGLVIDRELVDIPLEIGHMYVSYDNKPMDAESILSGKGLINLCKLNNLRIRNAEEFFALVRNKNKHAKLVFNKWICILGQYIANLQICYNVEKIILSGGVMKSSDLFYDKLVAKTKEYLLPFPLREIEFCLAKFDQDAGLMGGAAVAFNIKD